MNLTKSLTLSMRSLSRSSLNTEKSPKKGSTPKKTIMESNHIKLNLKSNQKSKKKTNTHKKMDHRKRVKKTKHSKSVK